MFSLLFVATDARKVGGHGPSQESGISCDAAAGGSTLGTVSAAGLEEVPDLMRVLHRELDLASLFEEVDRAVRDLVPFDISCWLSLDPATLLPTSHFTEEPFSGHLKAIAENEILDDDYLKFADLARSSPPVATLREATAGEPERSRRHREFLCPLGFDRGDEMRGVFLDDDGSAWGCVALHRREGSFTNQEVAALARVAQPIARAIQRSLLYGALTHGRGGELPGLILVAGDGAVDHVSPAARQFLDEAVDSTAATSDLPLVVTSLVADLRSARTAHGKEPRTVRVPSRSGQWFRLGAALLDDRPDGRVSVIVHEVRDPGLPVPVVERYRLTAREREVTGLVLRGCSTTEIASSLHLSPYTVQDHLKAVFAKLGVRSRRELVATIFARHYAPRLESGSRIGPDGWFVD